MKLVVLLPVLHSDNIKYLDEAIKSLKKQTFSQFDCYLLIDGPIEEELESYLDQINDNRFIILHSLSIRKLSIALNDGIKEALNNQATHIARMDSDDICYDNRFEKQLNYFSANPSVSILGTWFEEINEHGECNGKIVKFPTGHLQCKSLFKKRDPLCHPSVMFKADIFNKIGLYPTNYHNNEDSNLWCKAFKNNIQFCNVPEPLLYFRMTLSLLKRRKKYAYDNFLNKLHINKQLSFGITANMYALMVFLIKIQPLFISRIIYKVIR